MTPRWKAAAIHLSVSGAVCGVAALLVLGLWYPSPYWHITRALKLILLLLGVDVGIGPLLTLLVYVPGKRGLKFDLAVIAGLQLLALLYGMHVALASRPVFLVAAVDRLVVVGANEIGDDDLALGTEPEFRARSWTGPRQVAAILPIDARLRDELVFAAAGGRDLQNQPKYFRSYASYAPTLIEKAKPISALAPAQAAAAAAWLAQSGRAAASVRWVPLMARNREGVMLIDALSAEPLRSLVIDS